MEGNDSSAVVCVTQALNGLVYGVTKDGTVFEMKREAIRTLSETQHSAEDFETCEIQAVYVPAPKPSFVVDEALASDDGQGMLLMGSDEDEALIFGIVQLYHNIGVSQIQECLVPFRAVAKTDHSRILRIRWFPGEVGTLCVLREDGTLSVFDAYLPSYPIRIYKLKRYPQQPIGITGIRISSPVDIQFLRDLPWSLFTVWVLYSDGAVFWICPISPKGDTVPFLLEAASRRWISDQLLMQLLTEAVGRDSFLVPQIVPALQGPINDGLASFWDEEYSKGKSDSALELSCGTSKTGCITVTIGTSRGMLYGHILLENVVPEIVPIKSATVTSLGIRICLPFETGAKLHLMEIIELQRKPRKKVSLKMQQHPLHPELLYCHCAGELFRVKYTWVASILSGENLKSLSEKSQIWRFRLEADFLGFFFELDALMTVFRQGHTLSVSVFCPKELVGSFLEELPLEDGSKFDQGVLPSQSIQSALSNLQDASFDPLQKAYQAYECRLLGADNIESSLETLEYKSIAHQDTISELETKFQNLSVLTPESIRCIEEHREAHWLSRASLGDLLTIREQLNEACDRNRIV